MSATVYTQAEVDALLATAAAQVYTRSQVDALVASVKVPAGANIVVSKTEPKNAPEGTIWVTF